MVLQPARGGDQDVHAALQGLDLRAGADADDAMVFHAGTALDGHCVLRTSGGRVLCATALGDNVRQAQQRAYDLARGIHFDGMQYRRDIGFRAIKS